MTGGMKKVVFALLFVLILLSCASLCIAVEPALSVPIMPVDQIRAGMKGVAYTVFEGVKPEAPRGRRPVHRRICGRRHDLAHRGRDGPRRARQRLRRRLYRDQIRRRRLSALSRVADGDRAGCRGEAPPAASRGWRAFFGSLSLTLGNPKVMVFFLSIMPLVVDVRRLTPLALAELAARFCARARLDARGLRARRKPGARLLPLDERHALRPPRRRRADGRGRGRGGDEVRHVGPPRDRRGAGRTQPADARARPSCRASAATRRTR